MTTSNKPESKPCIGECGSLIEPEFREAVYFMGREVGNSGWRFPFVLRCCDCQQKVEAAHIAKKEELKKKEEEKIQNARIELLKKTMGLRGYEEYHLNKFIPSFGTNEAFKLANSFDPEKDNLYLWGAAGVGKSHLAGGILRKFFDYGRWTKFIKHAALNRSMQGLKSDEYDDQLKWYMGVEVMAVDDLGTAKRTEFSDQVLYEVLDGRYSNFKNGLVITSNLSLGKLAEVLGDDRLTSRIAGMCKIQKVEADDWRVKNGAKKVSFKDQVE